MVLGSAQAVRSMSMPRVRAQGNSWGRAREALLSSEDTVFLGLLSKVKAAEEEGAQVDGLEVTL